MLNNEAWDVLEKEDRVREIQTKQSTHFSLWQTAEHMSIL